MKENHVAAAGGVGAALEAVASANARGLPVEIEVRNLEELDEVLAAPRLPDRVMLDNFEIGELRRAVARIAERAPDLRTEASGNVSLETVRTIAETGVDWISVGALTHSAPALDFSCAIEPE